MVWTPDLSDQMRKDLGNIRVQKCLEHWNVLSGFSLDPRSFWPCDGVVKNLAQKSLECWNPVVGVDEGKNVTLANQRLSSTSDRN